jgi:lipopolysaccharide biosynthesis protein
MKRICIYAHYDSHGIIKDYVRYCLANIQKEFQENIFVSSSALVETEKVKIKNLCT